MLEKTIYEVFKNTCEKNLDKTAFRYKEDDSGSPSPGPNTRRHAKRFLKAFWPSVSKRAIKSHF